ncbi:MAG: hypothetical protein H0W64_04505 [Gammaproteobacteria bacterium]|nr:hypothetical protein [Gammaproteobacteria bacterium]
MKKLFFTLVSLCAATTLGATTMTSMTKDEVISTFAGNTITTIPLSTIDAQLIPNRITIYLDKSNKATGKLDTKPESNVQADEGTWTVSDDGALCITWQHWNEAKPFCDFAYNANNSFIFINAEGDFISLALKKNITPGNQFTQ